MRRRSLPSAEHVVEHARDPLDDLFVDDARRRQVDAGGREISAVGAAASVLVIGRQRRQRMEERPRLDLGVVRRRMTVRRLSAGT